MNTEVTTPLAEDPCTYLTQDQWDERFTVVEDAEGETIRDEAPVNPDAAEDEVNHHLWTVVEGDNGLYVQTGWHYVNRVGYVITEEPWDTEIEAVWHEYSDVEDEDDEADEES